MGLSRICAYDQTLDNGLQCLSYCFVPIFQGSKCQADDIIVG